MRQLWTPRRPNGSKFVFGAYGHGATDTCALMRVSRDVFAVFAHAGAPCGRFDASLCVIHERCTSKAGKEAMRGRALIM
jgi:hypothetical protein